MDVIVATRELIEKRNRNPIKVVKLNKQYSNSRTLGDHSQPYEVIGVAKTQEKANEIIEQYNADKKGGIIIC